MDKQKNENREMSREEFRTRCEEITKDCERKTNELLGCKCAKVVQLIETISFVRDFDSKEIYVEKQYWTFEGKLISKEKIKLSEAAGNG